MKNSHSDSIITKQKLFYGCVLNICLKNISHSFDGTEIMTDLSWTFEQGKFYLLKGESGCGKSTLLRMIAKLIKAESGTIEYGSELPVPSLRRAVQYLPQVPVMFPGSIRDNLLKPFSFPPYDNEAPEESTYQSLLDHFFPEGIDLEKSAEKLSQGQKQKIALCRVLLIDPEVLLCDEPVASLDEKSRRSVDEAIGRFFTDGKEKMVIYISHHSEVFANTDFTVIEMKSQLIEEAK